MKKYMSKLLSAMLIAALVFTSASVAFADEGGQKNTVAKNENLKAKLSTQIEDEALNSLKGTTSENEFSSKAAAATGNIKVLSMVTGNEIENQDVFDKYTNTIEYDGTCVIGDGYVGFVSSAKYLNKGFVDFAVGAVNLDDSLAAGQVSFGIYKDKALTQPVAQAAVAQAAVAPEDMEVYEKIFNITRSGNYYFGIKSSNTDPAVSQHYGVLAWALYGNGGDRTVTNGKKISVWKSVSGTQTNYFKFKAGYTGYLTVGSDERVQITLCNSKKAVASNAVTNLYRSTAGSTYNSVTFGVKKGYTYNVKVTASSKYLDQYEYYKLLVTNKAITEKSGTKKSRAATIKRGYLKKGTITAGSSQSDWYKFKLTGKKKVTVTMKGDTNKKMYMTLYKGNSKIRTSSFYYKNSSIKYTRTLSKGTYYIKISRADKYSSGWYSLKWR